MPFCQQQRRRLHQILRRREPPKGKRRRNGEKKICTLVDGVTRWMRGRGYWRAVEMEMC